jgi:hypothetical protein
MTPERLQEIKELVRVQRIWLRGLSVSAVDELLAEIERLTRELADTKDVLKALNSLNSTIAYGGTVLGSFKEVMQKAKHLIELEAENAKLREALTNLLNSHRECWPNGGSKAFPVWSDVPVVKKAQAALQSAKEKT